MSAWTLARRKPILRARSFSSSGNVVRAPAHSVNLSPEKMRALIAMYHQAETFVTKDNLDEKIHDAFVRRTALVNERTSLSLSDFKQLQRTCEDAPAVAEWNALASFNPQYDARDTGPSWSDRTHGVRDSKVIEALYGVEILAGKATLPGWDTLNDYREMIKTSDEEDREKYDDSDY
ncbi:hypothetical protein B0H19DRAFT_1177241 [Mycena capillaripes]|nr:hypothetical protein B0H19DRAFT_1177241 [Mycena capillaripes]